MLWIVVLFCLLLLHQFVEAQKGWKERYPYLREDRDEPSSPRDKPISLRRRFERIAKKLKWGETLGPKAPLRVTGLWRHRRVEVRIVDGGEALRYSAQVKGNVEFHVVRDPGSHGGRFVIREDGFGLGEQADRSARVLDDPWVRRTLASLTVEFGCTDLELQNGWLRVKRPGGELELVTSEVLRLLTRLSQLARSIEKVGKLSLVKATAVLDMASRQCPYCRDLLASEEDLDLTSCRHCSTVTHEACFKELGRCPAAGCGSKRSVPVTAPPDQIRQPIQIELGPCEVCDLRDQGCTPQDCHASLIERRRASRRRGEARRGIRRRSRDDRRRRLT